MRKKGFFALLIVAVAMVYFLWWTKGGKEKVMDTIKVIDVMRVFSSTEHDVTKANLTSLAKGILSFVSQEGRTPTSLKEIRMFYDAFEGIPDAWGTKLRYERISDEDFRLISAGKDKVFSTSDDIVIKF